VGTVSNKIKKSHAPNTTGVPYSEMLTYKPKTTIQLNEKQVKKIKN
jgi:hypothetical protein